MIRFMKAATLCVLISITSTTAAAQSSTKFTPAFARRADVRAATTWLEANFAKQVEEWIRLTEIPAPSGHEQARGAYVRAEMEKAGLQVTVDSIGNVIGVRKGSGGGPTVVFASHMDTVHPLGTDLKVRRDGDTLRSPGIYDNSASVANMLAVIRAMNHASIRTRGDLIFIGTTQEEVGLKGMDFWLERNPGVADVLVAMDGGLGVVNYGALGIYWTRYKFSGGGSHTNTSKGKPHPVRALAEAVESIYEIEIPQGRGTTVYNVGIIQGGKIFNAIPEEASFTMDLRSVNPKLLDSLDAEITARAERAAVTHKVQLIREVVLRNGAGGTEDQLADRRAHPLVQTAVDIYAHLGVPSPANPSGSTDANVAVVRGIPAISVGRSFGGDQHTISEWAHWPSALPATKAIVMLAMTMAGVAGQGGAQP